MALGIALGLVVGKTPRAGRRQDRRHLRRSLAPGPHRRCPLSDRVTQTHPLGVSMTAGVGFTVAIFVATLAFEDGDVIDLAKLGIMLGSLVAAVGGHLILRSGGQSGDTEKNADQP